MKEEEIVELLKKENEDFRKLADEHKELDLVLADMDRKVYLTTEEDLERKRLQKLKLSKKDRMAEMVRDFKKSH